MNERELFFRHLAQTSDAPLALEIVRAEGLYMYDASGKAYLDLISGISVSALGHRHPRIVEAVKDQLTKYMHLMVYGEFIQSPQVQLARLLAENLPETLDSVYLVNSGSEAVEGAVKLAKRASGRTGVVAYNNAYHGSTHGSLSFGGNEELKNAFRPLLPGVKHLRYNVSEDLHQIDRSVACVLMETIQGEAGAFVPDREFVQLLRQRCDENGVLLILDEIQAGMGRSGRLWCFQHFGIIPDILCLAKGLGGGMPIGAFIASSALMKSLTHQPVLGHISTFGGNAVCAAAALANLQEITQKRLWEGISGKELVFRRHLRHPLIRNVHGMGLLLAVEFDSFALNKQSLMPALRKACLLTGFCLHHIVCE